MEIKTIKKAFSSGSYSTNTTLPPQKVSTKKKQSKEWQKSCVDAMINRSKRSRGDDRHTWAQMKKAYDVMNDYIDIEDYNNFVHYLPGMEKFVSRPKIKNYNLLRMRMNRLESEALSRPFDYVVRATAGPAMDLAEEKKFNSYRNEIMQLVADSLQEGYDKQQVQDKLLEIKEQVDRSPGDITEEAMGKLMGELERSAEFEEADSRAVEHAVRGGKIIYRVEPRGMGVRTRAVNPLYFDYEKDPEEPRIEKSQWAMEHRFLTASDVVDLYSDDLTDEQVEKLDRGFSAFQESSSPAPYTINGESGYAGTRDHRSLYGETNTDTDLLNVYLCTWQSFKKIGFLTYEDPEEGVVEEIVDDTFKMTDDLRERNAEVEWKWINEVWEGVRVEADELLFARPVPGQRYDFWNPTKADLPYIGREMNSTGTENTSLVMMLLPFQIFFNLIFYKTEQEMKKSAGKIMYIDQALLPRNFSMEKTLAWAKYAGVLVIDSSQESAIRSAGGSPLQSQDDSMSQNVQILLHSAAYIEQIMDIMSGVTKQSLGQTQPSETATGVRTAVDQTSAVHAQMYRKIDLARKSARQKALETAEHQLFVNGEVDDVMGEAYHYLRSIDPDILGSSSFSVSLSSQPGDLRTMNMIESVMSTMVQNQQASVDDLVEAINSNSVAEATKLLRRSKERIERLQRQAQQAEQQAKMQEAQMGMRQKQMEMQHESRENELDRRNKLQVAAMKEDANLQGQAIKTSQEREKNQEDTELKKRELEIKEQDNLSNLEIAREQNKNRD